MPAVAAPPRHRRLGSLKNSGLGGKAKPAQRPATKKHTCCNDPKVEDDGEGRTICRNCFTQIAEANIVADVTFQEDARGAATVQGDFIGENARHAHSFGSGVARRIGGGEKNTVLEVERNGRRALNGLCPRLGIPDSVSNQANQLYVMSSENNFSAGRRTDEVIAACLYAACRRQKDNKIMLIDVSELLRLNVFRLGEVYKDLCNELYLKSGGVGTQYLVEVESLIMKFCRKLEFGDATRQVAEDAVKIVRRMKRDWMVTGRHPAGLCGACIILAARMNNFRRSIREVVWVAKVTDMTIMKRVQEFRRTKSAGMTVDQFREFGFRLKHQHDPPVLYESQLKKQKFEDKKRKRQAASVARAATEGREVIEIPDDQSNASSRDSSVVTPTPAPEQDEPPRKRQRTETEQIATPAPTQQEPRRDADGFAIPALPATTQAEGQEQEEEKPKKGRLQKQPPKPIVITEEELADEQDLENEIEFVLNDDEIIDSRNEIEKARDEERAKALSDQQKKDTAEKTKARRQSEGITWWDGREPNSNEEVTPEELEEQFADDPEVQNCLLSENEQKAKEQIWVFNNEDWLRQQQEKNMIALVAKSAGRDAKGRRPGKVLKRRKRGKMGDGTVLTEAATPIQTPADAAAAMIQKRAPGKWSSYIDYDAMASLFHLSPSGSKSTSRPGSTTTGTGPSSRNPTPTPAAPEGAQGSESSSSPTPAPGSEVTRPQTPPPTQQAAAGASPKRTSPAAPQVPQSPPPTQAQPRARTEEEESEGDEGDYIQDDELDYGSDDGTPHPYGGGDDREDIGEDDYQSAISPTGGWAVPEEAYGDDEEY